MKLRMKLKLRTSTRRQVIARSVSDKAIYALPVAAGLLFAVVLLAAFSRSPASTLDFLTGSFTSPYYFGSMLNTAALLMAAALGDALALTTGEYNLGGEGQIYAGGFIAAIVLASAAPIPSALLFALALLAALAAPALMALISVLLKRLKNADILLTSFLVSAAVIPFIDALIAGRFRGATNNLLATPFIPESLRFPQILPPSPLSIAALVPPLLCLAAWRVKYRTVAGRMMQITGISREFADYSGYNRNAMTLATFCLSGALHGLTGFVAVAGTYYTCHSGFYSGMGWNALSAALIANANPALIANANPALVAPASLALSWLFTSANRVALNNNFGFDISSLIQGVLLLSIAMKYAGGKRAKRAL